MSKVSWTASKVGSVLSQWFRGTSPTSLSPTGLSCYPHDSAYAPDAPFSHKETLDCAQILLDGSVSHPHLRVLYHTSPVPFKAVYPWFCKLGPGHPGELHLPTAPSA